jgi:FMN-dependent NADH-azoreductase
MKLLQIDSSARRSSISRQLTSSFLDAWKKENSGGEAMERDLSTTALPHITDDWAGVFGDPSKLTPSQQLYLLTSDELIKELIAADTIVIGAPMYNFTISSLLKAWIDQIVRPGKTFVYGEGGPRGLLGGRKVVVITSRGGSYTAGKPQAALDFQEPYLRSVLGFIGLTDITFIHAEYQTGGEKAEASRSAAIEQIRQVVGQQSSSLVAEVVH